jgi:spore maturation protein CgeB
MWKYGLPKGFEDIGHKTLFLNPLKENNIKNTILKFNPNLIIAVGFIDKISAEKIFYMLKEFIKPKIPLVYWATEDPHYIDSFSLPLINILKPDFIFTICISSVDSYKKLGLEAAHMDFGYHRKIHYKTDKNILYKSSLAVVANAYPNILTAYPHHYRNESLNILLTSLIRENLRVDFWGRAWNRMKPILGYDISSEWIHGYIPYKHAHKIYSSADIIIGLQNYPFQLTQRTYEILGSGGFLLTCDTPAVRSLFKPGEDLAVSSSPQETLKLVKYYLKNPDERKKISINGNNAVKGHCYKYRAEQIIKILREKCIFH